MVSQSWEVLEQLTEACPADAPVVFFDGMDGTLQPNVAEVGSLCIDPSQYREGLLCVYHYNGDDTAFPDSEAAGHANIDVYQNGFLVQEDFQTATDGGGETTGGEETDTELLLGAAGRGRGRGRRAPFPVGALKKPASTRKATAKEDPSVGEALQLILSEIKGLKGRMDTMEGTGASSSASGAVVPVLPATSKAAGVAPAAPQSILRKKGITFSPTPAPPKNPFASPAYKSAMDMAREALGGAAAPEAEGVAKAGKARTSDLDLEEAVARGGDAAMAALQLATLQTLRDLQNGKKNDKAEDLDLDDLLLLGASVGADGGAEGMATINGTRGVAGMMRLHDGVDKYPEKWSQAFDNSVQQAVDPSGTGLPWSLDLYGQRRIVWHQGPGGEDLERFFAMLAHLHALDRQGKHTLVGAKIGQFVKAIEQVNLSKGRWEAAWLFTGLPDPRPKRRLDAGLAHPAEFAASVSYLREINTLDDAAWKHVQQQNQNWWRNQQQQQPGGGKGDKNKGQPGGGKGDKNKGKNQGAQAEGGAASPGDY